jgi:hypothetical protein
VLWLKGKWSVEMGQTQTDECKVEGCERKVAEPNSLCIGCFGGLLTEEVIRTEDYRYIKNSNFKPEMGKRR